MATEVIKIVDPGLGAGYDYDSLTDWEAGEQADLVALDRQATAKCRSTNGTVYTDFALEISGWTTSFTCRIKIWADPSEEYRHTGVWDNTKVRFLNNYGYGYSISTGGNFVTIDGIQFSATGGQSSSRFYTNNIISNCIFKECGGLFWGPIYYNCLIYDMAGGGIMDTSWNPGYVYNCTFYNIIGYGIKRTASGYAYRIKNCLFFNCDTDFSTDSYANGTASYCATDKASGSSGLPAGQNNRYEQTFTFVDADNKNFHLASTDTGAKGFGTNLYNDAILPFQTDIDGQDRGGSGASWDIGADQYFSVSFYELPVNRQYVRGASATWYEVVDVYVLKDGVWVPDKIIKILDSGSWI